LFLESGKTKSPYFEKITFAKIDIFGQMQQTGTGYTGKDVF